jgi:MerR family Zn(II)-responsive transcriptional regulator of zntA
MVIILTMNESTIGNLLKIGDVATKAGTSVRTVRYYMEEGFIEPAARSAGGFYLFSPEAAETVFFISKLRQTGLSLKEIQKIYNARRSGQTGEEASSAVLEHLLTQRDAVIRKIKDYQKLKSELDAAVELVSLCRGCTNKPTREKCRSCKVLKNQKKLPLPVQAIL